MEHARETAMVELSVVQVARSGTVLQAKDHEIINEGAKYEQSEKMMQFLHHHQLATSLPLHSQSLGRCITGQ